MYFNSFNSEIKIEDARKESTDPSELFSPEVVTLEFSESVRKLPIYGYKSVTPDAFLDGEELVQGQFSLTLTDSNKFKDTLDTYTPEEIETINGFGVPGIKGAAPISRDLFNIKIWLKKTEMIIKENESVYSQDKQGYTDPRFEIKDVKITGYQRAASLDGSAILEFFNFIAKKVI